MDTDSDDFDKLLRQLKPEPKSLLILGAQGEAPARESVVGAFSLQDASTLDDALRADLGVVIGADPTHVSILARLRDIHCRRVLLLQSTGWANNDLLGLGFQRMEYEGQSVFLCDPNLTPPRDWNNASNWAHPQNFDKQRW